MQILKHRERAYYMFRVYPLVKCGRLPALDQPFIMGKLVYEEGGVFIGSLDNFL